MASTTIVTYEGDLRCKAEFEGVKTEFNTDAPPSIGGKGENTDPTTLVGAALGSCILTVMGIAASRSDIDFKGARTEIHKEMENAGNRIKSFAVKVYMPHNKYAEAEKAKLEAIANVCPVKHSLHSDIKVSIEFIYP
ncbi:MAG: OsmC family protein [Alphaproteobacteria bacterium]